tara:strand:+ start:85 stop:531 length:447 start_codon:yes stop_codon:yes gene_type:complete
MTTVDKDFKVKNGLQVTGGASFGGAIAAADPTESGHVTTKSYVDALVAMPVGDTAPSNPSDGDLWFDTTVSRLKFFYDATGWVTIATSNDFQDLPDHIHDNSIDGDGRIDTIFWDSASYDSPQIATMDGGTPYSESWDVVFDGGLIVA